MTDDENSNYCDYIKPLLMDREIRQQFQRPAKYLFKNLPDVPFSGEVCPKLPRTNAVRGLICSR